eukprot:5452730-Pyramimonas_sp.AAC.1
MCVAQPVCHAGLHNQWAPSSLQFWPMWATLNRRVRRGSGICVGWWSPDCRAQHGQAHNTRVRRPPSVATTAAATLRPCNAGVVADSQQCAFDSLAQSCGVAMSRRLTSSHAARHRQPGGRTLLPWGVGYARYEQLCGTTTYDFGSTACFIFWLCHWYGLKGAPHFVREHGCDAASGIAAADTAPNVLSVCVGVFGGDPRTEPLCEEPPLVVPKPWLLVSARLASAGAGTSPVRRE